MMEDVISFEDILAKLKLKKVKIISIVLAVVVLVGLYTLIMPQTYMAYASLMPPSNDSGGGGLSSFLQNVGGIIDLGGGQTDSKSKLMQSILKSRSVSEKIYKQLDLGHDKAFKGMTKQAILTTIPQMINVEVEKSGVIAISGFATTGYLPNDSEKKSAAKLSADITNVSIKALNEILIEKSNSSAKSSRIYIEGEIKKYEAQLDSVSLLLQNFQTTNKVLALEEQTEAIVSSAIEINTLLNQKKTQLNLAKIQYSDNSPQVTTLEKEVEFLKQQSLEVQNGTSGDAFAISLNEVPKLTKDYLELFRDKKVIVSVLSYLETQKHQEAIQEEKDTPVVEVLDDAIVPNKRYTPQRAKIVFITAFISTIMVLVIFSYLSYREIRKEMA
jgi:uncharacterized protein involved in exopolysaccharide biosynthesis